MIHVFALLLQFYAINNCTSALYVSSPKADWTLIDAKATTKKHPHVAQHILAVHALTGADTVPGTFGIRKKRALKALEIITVDRISVIGNSSAKCMMSLQKEQGSSSPDKAKKNYLTCQTICESNCGRKLALVLQSSCVPFHQHQRLAQRMLSILIIRLSIWKSHYQAKQHVLRLWVMAVRVMEASSWHEAGWHQMKS